MIKVVLFDMGDTIINVPETYKTYDRILRAHGITRTEKEIATAHKQTLQELSLDLLPKLTDDYWPRFDTLLVQKLGITQNQEELGHAINREWWNYAETKPYPDVLPTLRELKKRKLKLALVTNGLESDINAVLSKINLTEFFDVKVGTDTFKAMKPDKTVFLQTLRLLNAEPAEALFIGDSLEIDYNGAKAAGFKAIIIDRNCKNKNTTPETIHTLTELLDYL